MMLVACVAHSCSPLHISQGSYTQESALISLSDYTHQHASSHTKAQQLFPISMPIRGLGLTISGEGPVAADVSIDPDIVGEALH